MVGMRLTIVGCSGSYPGPDSPASCYLVEAEGPDGAGGTRTWRILLDLGNGALGQLHRYADPLAIDAVLISHHHADHCLDLCGYYVMRKYHPSGPQPPIPVWGPSGTGERLARAYELPIDPGMTEEFDVPRARAGPAVTIGPFDGRADPRQPPGRGLRAAGHRRRCHPRLQRRHRDLRGHRPGRRRCRPVPLRGVVPRRGRQPARHPPHRGRGRSRSPPGRGRRGWCSPTCPPWFDRDGMLAEARASYDGPVELAGAGDVYDIAPGPEDTSTARRLAHPSVD